MLANSLRKLDKPINFGDWTAIQQFVRGLTDFAYDARLAEPTSPAAIEKRKQDRVEIIQKLLGAADKFTDKSPGAARDIVSFASFFAGRMGEYGLAADALDSNASLFSDRDLRPFDKKELSYCATGISRLRSRKRSIGRTRKWLRADSGGLKNCDLSMR